MKDIIGKVFDNADFLQIEIIDVQDNYATWKFVGETKIHRTKINFDGKNYFIFSTGTRIYLR